MHPLQEDDFSLEEILQEFGHPHRGGSPDPQASALLDPALQSPIPRHRTMDPDPETQRPNVADTLPERQIPLQPAEKQAPAATPQDAPSPATGLQAEDASGRPEPAREGPSAPVHGPKAPHHGFAPAEASRQPAPSSRGPEGPGAPVWVASASRRQGQASETPPATEPPLRPVSYTHLTLPTLLLV